MYKKSLSKIIIVLSVSMISSFTYAAGHLSSHNSINKPSPSHTNKEKSLYVVISFKGNIYAVPYWFIKSHPGGSDVLYNVSGYDISTIWEKDQKYSFHLWKKRVSKYLDKFKIGKGSLPKISVKDFDKKMGY